MAAGAHSARGAEGCGGDAKPREQMWRARDASAGVRANAGAHFFRVIHHILYNTLSVIPILHPPVCSTHLHTGTLNLWCV